MMLDSDGTKYIEMSSGAGKQRAKRKIKAGANAVSKQKVVFGCCDTLESMYKGKNIKEGEKQKRKKKKLIESDGGKIKASRKEENYLYHLDFKEMMEKVSTGENFVKKKKKQEMASVLGNKVEAECNTSNSQSVKKKKMATLKSGKYNIEEKEQKSEVGVKIVKRKLASDTDVFPNKKKKTVSVSDDNTLQSKAEVNIGGKTKLKKKKRLHLNSTRLAEEVKQSSHLGKCKTGKKVTFDLQSPLKKKRKKFIAPVGEDSLTHRVKGKHNSEHVNRVDLSEYNCQKQRAGKSKKKNKNLDESKNLGTQANNQKGYLQLHSQGFVWDVPQESEAKSDTDLSDTGLKAEEEKQKQKRAKKSSRAEKNVMALKEEIRLREAENARLEDRAPQSVMDFEELLQGSRNSSAVWIQYISFHLQSAEIEKARAVAARALKMIDTTEEDERINVWTVLLRLEVLYGTPQSVEAAFKEALVTNDEFKACRAMAMVYAEANKLEEAENVYNKMLKKFGAACNVWISAAMFFYSKGLLDKGRNLLDKGMLKLPKKEYLNFTNRIAQLEYRYGEPERGCTLFESLVSNFPKRTDIWSVYVDLLRKSGDIEGARHVLERMTTLKLKLRQMRFVFKKQLNFEREYGTPQCVEAVKKRVEQYVTSVLKDS